MMSIVFGRMKAGTLLGFSIVVLIGALLGPLHAQEATLQLWPA
jgi:hypothetical protein